MQDRRAAAYIAEFLGTLLLVFFIGVVVVQQGPISDFAAIGLVHTFVLAMLIFTLGPISGGHFNPAVTAGILAIRKISPRDAGIYVAMQVAGGIVGALLVGWLITGTPNASHGFDPAVGSGLKGEWGAGAALELIGTFALVFAIIGLAVNPKAPAGWAALGIGATLGMAVMAIAPLTGAGFNPARSLGPAISANSFWGGGKFILVYLLAPVVGGVLAAVVYRVLADLREEPALAAGPLGDPGS
ncbi:MAG: aquaporin [Solirubrobacteraceae bacterium]|jgi:MIP family channel proteins